MSEIMVRIINNSKSIVYVTILDAGAAPVVTGPVDPGRCMLFHVLAGQTRMTLSCYSKHREMENLITARMFKKSCTLRVVD